MSSFAEDIYRDLETIREKAPLVLSVTNYVAAPINANALLALGASPIMSHQIEEIEDLVNISGAVVANMGIPADTWPDAMYLAGECANKRDIPVVFDPVGAGASGFRNQVVATFLNRVRPAIIRGNGSEITAVAGEQGATKGVDSTMDSSEAEFTAEDLARKGGCVVCVSGPVDLVTDSQETISIKNGHPMMPRVTGLGCTATALCAAFAAVNPSPVRATAHAMAIMGIAGEKAAEKSDGPGTLQVRFLDALYTMDRKEIEKRVKMKVK